MSVTIDASRFSADVRRIESEILAATRQALGQAAAFAAELARRTTTFKDRTGKLRASIRRGQTDTWNLFVTAGDAKTTYGTMVEEGTRAHAIVGRRSPRKVLRFIQNGHLRFAKRVWHPGTKPTRFMRDARDAAELKLHEFLEAGLRSIFQ